MEDHTASSSTEEKISLSSSFWCLDVSISSDNDEDNELLDILLLLIKRKRKEKNKHFLYQFLSKGEREGKKRKMLSSSPSLRMRVNHHLKHWKQQLKTTDENGREREETSNSHPQIGEGNESNQLALEPEGETDESLHHLHLSDTRGERDGPNSEQLDDDNDSSSTDEEQSDSDSETVTSSSSQHVVTTDTRLEGTQFSSMTLPSSSRHRHYSSRTSNTTADTNTQSSNYSYYPSSSSFYSSFTLPSRLVRLKKLRMKGKTTGREGEQEDNRDSTRIPSSSSQEVNATNSSTQTKKEETQSSQSQSSSFLFFSHLYDL